jgi:hypothetical protein
MANMEPKLHFEKSDFTEIDELVLLSDQMDALSAEEISQIGDEIFMFQPFMLSNMVGFHLDVSKPVHSEIIKLYFLLWKYYKKKDSVSVKITLEQFEKVNDRDIAILKQLSNQHGTPQFMETLIGDMQKTRSKSLLSIFYFRFETRPVLKDCNNELKIIILNGLKSFITCFDEHIH